MMFQTCHSLQSISADSQKNPAAASLKLLLADGTERVPYYVLGLTPCYQTKSNESMCVCVVCMFVLLYVY